MSSLQYRMASPCAGCGKEVVADGSELCEVCVRAREDAAIQKEWLQEAEWGAARASRRNAKNVAALMMTMIFGGAVAAIPFWFLEDVVAMFVACVLFPIAAAVMSVLLGVRTSGQKP